MPPQSAHPRQLLATGQRVDIRRRTDRERLARLRGSPRSRELAHYMVHHDLPSSPITTSDGRLVGLLRREDAARVALEQTRGRHDDHEAAG